MKRKIRVFYYDFIVKNFKSDSRTPFTEFFRIYRNIRDIEVSLTCTLHNTTQLVTSHCLTSFEKYGSNNKKHD